MTSNLIQRTIAALLALVAMSTSPALSRSITDSAGRTVEIPDAVNRVFAAGPPASTLLYVLAPDKMIGWVRTPRAAEKPYLLPSVRDLPELGRLTGRGDTLNLERLISAKPDIIIDYGTASDTYKSLADRVQSQTGIPYLLVDGRFENTASAVRMLADVLGVKERGEAIAAYAEQTFAAVDRTLSATSPDKRPRVYLARGPQGLETGTRGSINTEIIERAGGINVVQGLQQKGGIATVSPEQVIAWAPDTIITMDPQFYQNATSKPEWQPVPAIQQKRIHLAPNNPFGFIDSPPSLNRLIGLKWMLHTLYREKSNGDLRDQVKAFYKLFYQVDLTGQDLDALLAQSGG